MSSFFRDLLESVGLRKRSITPVGLRAHRDVVVPLGIDEAYERARDAFERVLGANIYLDDRRSHTIEAGFGTVNQERVRATFEPEAAGHTRIIIEAHYPAGVERPPRSAVVDALADALSPQD